MAKFVNHFFPTVSVSPIDELRDTGVVFKSTPQLLGTPRFAYAEIYEHTEQPPKRITLAEFQHNIVFGTDAFLDSSNAAAFPNDVVKLTIVKRPNCNAGKITIGNNACLQGTAIVSYESVTIGDNALFGPNVVIMDCDGHTLTGRKDADEVSRLITKPVSIGNNVWIGYGAIITKGVSIGDNAVIGAGSVVHKNVPSNTVYAGNPAQFIKHID
ncbi:acyltransferase [Pseudoalteromonas sp. JBTF-M23]|uniref:Acyltransferase n=1 Tax=Pseudoalteromonas caenipelagi TaxID=2726988 RepID=A0A849VGP6_9GAMM|nr:acyltransferase [Pseudoalteromonas caenipelagi]NOU50881.1 acyltransferase [Pseudoalteromonas caenipelagi]